MKKYIFGHINPVTLLLVFILTFSLSIFAQNDVEKLKAFIEEDSTLIDGLAGFDHTIRTDVLNVSRHPELLDKLIDIQSVSQKAFQNILEPYSQDVQFGLYELSRYPDLITALTINGKKSKKEVEQIVLAYPEDIHESAKKYGSKQFDALISVNHLNEKNKTDFERVISTYNNEVQTSIKRLLDYPEILAGMSENMDFIRLIGNVYRDKPDELQAKLKERHEQINIQKQQELEDYQMQLKEDKEAMDEMVDAAQRYSSENGGGDVTQPIEKETKVVYVHHYSYWYGYPYWYTSPYWRPYPWYFHTGFYYGPGGGMVFIGMPSYYYVGWHHRRYPNRYPHLSYHYCRHSYRHPYSRYNFNRTVNININNNNKVNRDNLVKIDDRRGNQVMRPSTRPGGGTNGNGNRPVTKPADRPANRPATKPANRPVQPSQRPVSKPELKPTQRPSTQPTQRPSTRPAQQPSTRPMNYNNYRSNESFRQNMSAPRPVQRPSGGGAPARRR